MSRRTKNKFSRRRAFRASVLRSARAHSHHRPCQSKRFKQLKRARVSHGSVQARSSTLRYLNTKRRGGMNQTSFREWNELQKKLLAH